MSLLFLHPKRGKVAFENHLYLNTRILQDEEMEYFNLSEKNIYMTNESEDIDIEDTIIPILDKLNRYRTQKARENFFKKLQKNLSPNTFRILAAIVDSFYPLNQNGCSESVGAYI